MKRLSMKQEVLAIIPARGGSKGVPRKNVRPILGKPLLAYSIEHAKQTPAITRVVVSTDDQEIADVAVQYGAEVVWRPADISGDTATSESALIHVVDYLRTNEAYEPDLIVFLQCTSPIRQPDDIANAIRQLLDEKADSLLSVTSFHGFVWSETAEGGRALNYDPQHRPRRQDRDPEYVENGSIYVFKPAILQTFANRLGGKIALYQMDDWSRIDIDSMEDFTLAAWRLEQTM